MLVINWSFVVLQAENMLEIFSWWHRLLVLSKFCMHLPFCNVASASVKICRKSLSSKARCITVIVSGITVNDRQFGDVDSRPSTEGRLEVVSATQYNRNIFNNARVGNAFGVAGNQVNNAGPHNSTQMTQDHSVYHKWDLYSSLCFRVLPSSSLTAASGGHEGPGLYGGAGGPRCR